MSNLTIRTNNKPRLIIDDYQLTEKERQEFDYLDWQSIDRGEDSASFLRYKGQLYDLGEFMYIGADSHLSDWDGYASHSYFSGVVVKFTDDRDHVIVGQYFC